MKKFLTRWINWFYFPFIRKYIPLEMFRYAFCGVGNLGFEIVMYAVCYNFVFDKTNLDLGFKVISPHVAALLLSSPVAALTGYWLQKNITFRTSPLRGRTQFFRYVMVYLINLGINYPGVRLLVEVFGFYPTPSKMAITVVTVIFSFLMQKYFTFWRPKGES